MGYDDASQVTLIRHSKSDDTQVAKYEYAYNDAGVRTSVLEGNNDRVTWSYDNAWRLTREARSGDNAYDMTYTFDAVGNRMTKVTGGVTTTFTFNEADQLTVQNAGGTLTTLSFDAAGNNTVVNANGTRTTYTWDMADRLTGIALSGGGLVTMFYSATGLRRVRQDGSGTVKYLWDGQSPLMETDGDGNTTARYTGASGAYGPIVSQRRGNTSRFFHPNDLGTFDTLTDADAATTDTYILDAWGVQHASSGSTTNPFRYIGALGYYTEPDLALAYVRARWLRPATGSWLSVDPVEGELRYGYVRGRATSAVDPSGRKTPRECTDEYEDCLKDADAWWVRCTQFTMGSPSGVEECNRYRERLEERCARDLANCMGPGATTGPVGAMPDDGTSGGTAPPVGPTPPSGPTGPMPPYLPHHGWPDVDWPPPDLGGSPNYACRNLAGNPGGDQAQDWCDECCWYLCYRLHGYDAGLANECHVDCFADCTNWLPLPSPTRQSFASSA